jgi:hypothetical protein
MILALDVTHQVLARKKIEDIVIQRTKELNDAYNALKSNNEELKKSNNNLEDFAYAASHDLKEPIRKIRTFANRIRANVGQELIEQNLHYFDRMDKSTERMQVLIDDLLEYSHVSTATGFVEDIDLNKKIKLVLEDLELEVADRKAKVTAAPLPVIKGHRRQIQQLFQNLITNALKFSKPGVPPEINITHSLVTGEDVPLFNLSEQHRKQPYHLIEISDNGIGFEQEYSDKIFKMFQRLHGKAEYSGTGVGLAIVRKVVENHKGYIRADSEPGIGASFKVLLPVE